MNRVQFLISWRSFVFPTLSGARSVIPHSQSSQATSQAVTYPPNLGELLFSTFVLVFSQCVKIFCDPVIDKIMVAVRKQHNRQ